MTDISTLGDLARQLVQRRQNADVRARMNTLLEETGSGRKSDLSGSLDGDYSRLAAFEGDLASLAAFASAGSELSTRLETAQRAMGAIQSATLEFSGSLIGAPNGLGPGYDVLSAEAADRFADVVAALNTELAGRSLFAGVATDSAALASSDAMLTDLEALVIAASDAATAEAAIRDWFAPGGGFDTVGYLGAGAAASGQPVARGVRLGFEITAEEGAFRETLSALALAAFSGLGPFSGDPTSRHARLVDAGVALSTAQDSLAALRGQVGSAEARLEELGARNAAEIAALEASRAALVEVDLYDSAAELEAVQSQLELLYAITARSARLSLVSAL